MDKTKIFIVEDHPIFRMGLKELIDQESDMEVCGEAEDVAEARKAIINLNPDVLILDLSLKNSSGMELLEEIGSQDLKIPVLVLSMYDETVHAQRCIQAGAKGYIQKQEASASVVKAIRHIMEGNCYFSDRIMAQVLSRFQSESHKADKSPLATFSTRELEVFHMIGRGLTSGEIAEQLCLSVKTIGTYRERIKEKLGCKHNGELVRIAVLYTEHENVTDSMQCR
jgi:DNA-binding NarL/FixJ family response regulator